MKLRKGWDVLLRSIPHTSPADIAKFVIVSASTTSEQKEFSDRYQKRFSIKPTGESVYAYDDIYVLAGALKKCDADKKVKDSNCIAEQLLKTDYNGAAGRLTFTDKGVSNRNTTAIVVKDGLWKETPID